MSNTEVRTICNVIDAQPTDTGIVVVRTTYAETDAMNAVGQIWRHAWNLDSDDPYDGVLNTNDTLVALWTSPKNALWVTSARGLVWTTAPCSWPTAPPSGFTLESYDPKLQWRVAKLPPLDNGRGHAIVNAIWGASDDDVHLGTYQGLIYHWDGKSWTQQYGDDWGGINKIHGVRGGAVFAVGEKGTILVQDKQRWRKLPYPGDPSSNDGLTGVRVLPSGEVYVCGRSGRLLHGSSQGIEVLLETSHSLYGLAWFKERIILAGGDDGVLELKGKRVVPLRDTFAAVGVFENRDWLACVEPFQEDGSGIVIYAPGKPDRWTGSYF